jgi:hypothetical protein
MKKLWTILVILVGSGLVRGQPPAAPLSVEDQLQRDRIIPGSALARLVRANQEFNLLAAHERPGTEKVDVPRWLKVYYRKQHPHIVSKPNDPTHGYPLALENVYRWMITHQDLRPAPAAAIPARAPLAQETNVRISGAQETPRSESDIRVNFTDGSLVIAASNNISGEGRQAQFYSVDGGLHWGQTNLPLVASDQFQSDPTVDWTSDGTAWATTMGIESTVMRMRSYKSVDHGMTWTFDAVFSGDQTEVDKQMMWVDHSPTSPYRDNIYVIWHNSLPAFVNRRTGPAGSWQTPIQVSGAETTGTAIGSDIKTNGAGEVFAFWPDTGSQKIFMAKSSDGGVHFTTSVLVTQTFGSFQVAIPAFANRRALIGVSGGAYKAQQKDLVYACWMDLSGETGCSTPENEPGTDPNSACKTRIWFARSVDGGQTWAASNKKMINPSADKTDQFNHKLAVDETNGTLVVSYYDTTGDAQRKGVNVWYQTSTDDGVSWSAPVKLTTASTNETTAGADSGNQFGDYNGLSGNDGKFIACWTDRRNGMHEEIWASPITAGPPNLAVLPASVRAAITDGNGALERVRWSSPARDQDGAQGIFPVYRVHGVDDKGSKYEVLLDAHSHRALGLASRTSFLTAKKNLPETVSKALSQYQQKNPAFQPDTAEAVFVGGKLSSYRFRGKEDGKKHSVTINAIDGKIIQD